MKEIIDIVAAYDNATKQGIKTTKKEVAITLEDVNHNKAEFRQLVHTFNNVCAERDRLKAKCVP